MNRDQFVHWARDTGLTEKQAEAFYRREVGGDSRQDAAAAMGTSTSNVDNLERAAREKVMKASNLMALLDGVGYEYDGELGACAECDEPTRALTPDPDDDAPLEDRRMLCPDCKTE